MANKNTEMTFAPDARKAAEKSLRMQKRSNRIKKPAGDRVLEGITTFFLIMVVIIVGYPVVYVVSASFSSAAALQNSRVVLWPVEPSLDGYKFVLAYRQVWIGYRNTLFYTSVGSLMTMTTQILCAYPLSRPRFNARKAYTKVLLVVMLVHAGMVPTFLVKTSLGLYDTIWAVLLSACISTHNVFILRTAFKSSIPQDLFDAAAIDGANEFQSLVKIALPLAKATISVVTLYAIVGRWNEYFTAMIYLRNEELYPLSLFLRTMLVSSKIDVSDMDASSQQQAQNAAEQLKYALIVMSTVPVLIAYGVVQKYFKTGVMIGSVKG